MSIVLLAAGVGVAALGTLVLGALAVPVPPDLFLLPVAAAARRGAAVKAMLTGLLAGFLQDALAVPARLYGLNAFSKVLAGYLLAAVGARTIVERPLAAGALVAAASLAESFAVAGLLWVLRGEFLFPSVGRLVVRVGATGAIGAVVHALARQPWKERWAARRRRARL